MGHGRIQASPAGQAVRRRDTFRAYKAGGEGIGPASESQAPSFSAATECEQWLPLGEGTILDPFAGAGSTLAAGNAMSYSSIGIEKDRDYFLIARERYPEVDYL